MSPRFSSSLFSAVSPIPCRMSYCCRGQPQWKSLQSNLFSWTFLTNFSWLNPRWLRSLSWTTTLYALQSPSNSQAKSIARPSHFLEDSSLWDSSASDSFACLAQSLYFRSRKGRSIPDNHLFDLTLTEGAKSSRDEVSHSLGPQASLPDFLICSEANHFVKLALYEAILIELSAALRSRCQLRPQKPYFQEPQWCLNLVSSHRTFAASSPKFGSSACQPSSATQLSFCRVDLCHLIG